MDFLLLEKFMSILFLNLGFKNVLMWSFCLPSFSLEGIFITEKKILKIEYFKWKFSHTVTEPQMLPVFENEGDFSLLLYAVMASCDYGTVTFMLPVLNCLNILRFVTMLCERDKAFKFKSYLCSIKCSLCFRGLLSSSLLN